MSEILFRCSKLGELVSGGDGITKIQLAKLEELKAKQASGKITDNQLIELGQLLEKKKTGVSIGKTTETFIRSMWLHREYGYKEEMFSDETLKGHLCEQDSMDLVNEVLGGEFRAKNRAFFKNEYVCGTPDIILSKEDFVEDVKTSFNLRTFTESELLKLYWWQGQGYMWLTGKRKYRLIYCLVPTPEELLARQKSRYWYMFGQDETNPHYIDIADQIDRNNNVISEIPISSRIKVFNFEYEPDKIELLKEKIEVCRKFYQTLSLPLNTVTT